MSEKTVLEQSIDKLSEIIYVDVSEQIPKEMLANLDKLFLEMKSHIEALKTNMKYKKRDLEDAYLTKATLIASGVISEDSFVEAESLVCSRRD